MLQFNTADIIISLLTLLPLQCWSLFSSLAMECIHELPFDLVDQIKPKLAVTFLEIAQWQRVKAGITNWIEICP